METRIAPELAETAHGLRAEKILRSCVHCGFCNATCPTYQLLGDELDGPRGRIYLIKEVLETNEVNAVIGQHLDRCLTCRACETTCPSGVEYGELLEIGRELIQPRRKYSLRQKLIRNWLLRVVPHAKSVRAWIRAGRMVRWFLPPKIRAALPVLGKAVRKQTDRTKHSKKVLLLEGCVQSAVTPQVNQHLIELFDSAGIETITVGGCCGSLALHLSEREQAEAAICALIDTVTSVLDGLPAGESDLLSGNTGVLEDSFSRHKFAKVDAILSTASGCGVTVKDYQHLLEGHNEYAGLAAFVSIKIMDIAEYLERLDVRFIASKPGKRISWHAPCTLQHGQKITGVVESLLVGAGYELLPVADQHLCCGSAGSYSLLEPDLSFELRDNKLACLLEGKPEVIATANIGCQSHLQSGAGIPVVHWIELLAPG